MGGRAAFRRDQGQAFRHSSSLLISSLSAGAASGCVAEGALWEVAAAAELAILKNHGAKLVLNKTPC